MRSYEEIRQDILSWLKDPCSDDTTLQIHIGKTITRIQYIGNGANLITFSDGTHLLFHVEDMERSGDDLYNRDDTVFNFETWEWKEEEEEKPE